MQRHQIQAQHLLGHGVLDLQTRIGLDEVPVTMVGIEQEFKGAEPAIVGMTCHAQRGIEQRVAGRGVEMRRRRDLYQLLMPPLGRAVPLPQMRDCAATIAQHLHFDMSCIGDETLGIHTIVTESRQGLGATGRPQRRAIGPRRHHAHATATAAGRRLDHHRHLCVLRGAEIRQRPCRHQGARRRERRHLAQPREIVGRKLVAEQRELGGCRTNEDETCRFTGRTETCLLGQETIAWMHTPAAGSYRLFDDRAGIEIGRRAASGNVQRAVGA